MTLARLLARGLLRLYPPAFRLEFGQEIAADWDDAIDNACQAHGWLEVFRLWLHLSADLIKGAIVQWSRTIFPAVAVVSLVWSTTMFTFVAYQYVQLDPTLLPRRPVSAGQLIFLTPIVIVPMFALLMHAHAWLRMLNGGPNAPER